VAETAPETVLEADEAGTPDSPEAEIEETVEQPVVARHRPTITGPVAATGRRKEAIARVRLVAGSGNWTINGRTLDDYFPNKVHQQIAGEPFKTLDVAELYDVIARIEGGGVSGQAGALRHGISRALIVADPHLRGELKRRGFLTRDPRVKERKKAGLKKARKRPQFSKR
jgi:small subunit ribosomal protein S9